MATVPPDPNTASAPPSWPDHPSPDNPHPVSSGVGRAPLHSAVRNGRKEVPATRQRETPAHRLEPRVNRPPDFYAGRRGRAAGVTNYQQRFRPGLVAFAMTVARRAAVEVRRCYCVVTKSEFAVPPSEQLQTRRFRGDFAARYHLISQSRGSN
ncbi:PPE23 domain protein [Mycobacterium avium subsp. avium 2285 (R)]|nr:PPE23 domain protein [Mycobacterium avium subsp. avium 2285 (R)]